MIHDHISNWRLYPFGPGWACAMHYLETLTAESEVADRVPLDGDAVFARIMAYTTRGPEQGELEAHDRYVDIQMSLAGAERIECHPRSALEVTAAYDPDNDFTLYRRPGPAPATVDNHPGYFTVLFPDDAHLAQLCVGAEPAPVKKVVVKVLASRLFNEEAANP